MSKRQRLHVSQLPNAEKISGLRFTAKEHRLMIDGVNDQLTAYESCAPSRLITAPHRPSLSIRVCRA